MSRVSCRPPSRPADVKVGGHSASVGNSVARGPSRAVRWSSAAVLLAAAAGFAGPASADTDLAVVASIKPVHSLVAAVMGDVGTPVLLVQGAASPHTYSMRPSEARSLADADVVFWVGDTLEPFLVEPLATLAGDAQTVPLSSAPGTMLLPFREGGAFEDHDHGHADGEDHAHDDHGHDHAHDDHGHDHAHDDHGHDHAHDDHAHDHAGMDLHLWLDPVNAQAMVTEIAERLATADPENAAIYRENADQTKARLDDLIVDVTETLAPVKDGTFIVFHDAYQYFENRFGLSAAGSITVSPEVAPGARRLNEIRERISGANAACVFAEPQFEPRIVEVVVEGTGARTGVLDPLGAGLEDGPDLYFTLLETLADSFVGCLSESG